jgi:hypothetical protein
MSFTAMATTDTSTKRVITVIALLLVAALALRGHLPGSAPVAEPGRSRDNPAALIVVVGMVTTAVAIIGVAIVLRMRDRTPRRPTGGEPFRRSGTAARPTWRLAVIALAVMIAWLALVAALSSLGGGAPAPPPTSAPPAADTAPAPPRDAAPPEPPSDTDVVRYLIPPMLVLMVLVVIGTVVAARRQQRPAPPDTTYAEVTAPARAPASDTLARAAEVGLAEIGDLSREPRDAIIACYAAMERELMRVPGAVPQDCDTPTEVLARAVARHALRPDSATELVDLFEEARFSPHVMTEAHRDAAVRVLERVVAELPRMT